MKHIYSILLIVFLSLSMTSYGKDNKIDSLIHQINTTNVDSTKLKLLDELSWDLMFTKPDTALIIGNTALNLSKSILDSTKIIDALNSIATAHAVMGDYNEALKFFNNARELAELKEMAKSLSKIYNNLGLVYWNIGEIDSAISLYNQALEQYESRGKYSVGMANTNNNLGLIYKNKGEKDLAIKHYEKSLLIFDSLGRKDANVANTINNLGIVFSEKGNFPVAMEYYLKALKVYEDADDQSSSHANTLINIGNLYKEQGELNDALNYYKLAEAMHQKIGSQNVSLATAYGAIGGVYIALIQEEKAIEYLKKALEIQEAIGDKTQGTTEVLTHLGQLYMDHRRSYSQAKSFFNRALQLQEELGDRNGIAGTYYYLGLIDIRENKYNQGINKCKKSYDLSIALDLLKTRQNACSCLSFAYEKINQPSKALHYFKLYVSSRDSLENRENTKAITQKQMHYEFEKIQYQDSLKRAEEAKLRALEQREKDLKKEEEIRRQRTYAVSGGIGFILMFGLAFVLFRGYQNKQKSNEIISAQKAAVEKQKSVIEEKNKEILDSINYAKKIQNIILPDQKLLDKELGENFVFFRPKDIVSGDFYWLSQKKEGVFFSVIDCTGHGVPGALVSIVANNSLNQVLNEDKLRVPALILDSLNKHVEEHFSSTSNSINDGMDLALCKLDRTKMELEYAGANNSIYIIRHSAEVDTELKKVAKRIMISDVEDKILYEIQADKQPIGKYEYRTAFTNHTVKVIEGDSIYIFSDGFADQFGGDKGKKFMYKPFKKLLLDISSLEMDIQKREIQNVFDRWKKDIDQVDDVCVMGVKV